MIAKLFCVGLAITLLLSPLGAAEEPKPVLALSGNCPVCLIDSDKTVEGDPKITSVHGGFEYRFPNLKTKKKFDSKPEKYAIQFDGHCAVSRRLGRPLKGVPDIYAVYDKRIFIFSNEEIKQIFLKNPEKYAGKRAELRRGDAGGSPAASGPQHEF